METITLTIDGKQVTAEAGGTVLEAARAHGIEIPTICAHDDLPSYGACRLCVVEIDGVRGYPTSCTTPVADGMVVRTQTPALQQLRKEVLELMFSGHPNACLVCDHREECERYRPRARKTARATRCGVCSNRASCTLRDMALGTGAPALDLPTLYCNYNLERDDPFIDRDHNLCILCGRCWRICEQIHGTPAISINNRGRWAKIGTAFEKSYVVSGCTFCGACIDICPTGTLTDRYARWYGASDPRPATTCTICPNGCSVEPMVNNGTLTASRMTAFNTESRLCAVGRFGYAQLMNAPKRLRVPMIRERGELIPVDWEEAVATMTEKLAGYKDGAFVAIVDEANTRENLFCYEQFATKVMKGRAARIPAGGTFEAVSDAAVRRELEAGTIKAALVTGAQLSAELAERIEYLIVVDCFPSEVGAKADALLPAAILGEIGGTFRNAEGEVKALCPAARAPGWARNEWEILRDLARRMTGGDGEPRLDYASVEAVAAAITNDPAPAAFNGVPRDRLADVPTRFRGHYIADYVPALEAIGAPASPKPEAAELTGGFRIAKKQEIVPNFHLLTIEAPTVAEFAKPGQFIIVMVRETSERAPFTLIDWDKDAGTIDLIIEEVGRSSGEIARLKEGDFLAHITGPLGLPLEIGNVGTVVLGGGCYGIGAIYPIARGYKEAGAKVICAIEASSSFLLYLEEKMKGVCDELVILTKDGSRGTKGGVQDAFVDIVKRGTKVDEFVAIGCTFMMRMVAEATRPLGIPLQVALNPIMVDGTGMCGACRVSVGGETKFACVDGPFFDGHAVDWDELGLRRGAYAREEIEALPQRAGDARRYAELTHAGQCLVNK